MIIGCGLMVPIQAFAETTNNKTEVKKEIRKTHVQKVSGKKHAKNKVTIKKVAKKAVAKKANAAKKADKQAAKRKVTTVDFTKSAAPAKKVQLVSHKDFQKRDFHPRGRQPASHGKAMTVEQLKKSTKPYWANYCRDGIVLNSQVYCALKHPQKQALKAGKQVKMAANKDLEAKKRK
jgi:hypothetical protein